MSDLSEIITISDASVLKGVNRQSIYNAIVAGKIRIAISFGSKRLLYRPDVESYIPFKSAGKRGRKDKAEQC